jgi:hypothetical protein
MDLRQIRSRCSGFVGKPITVRHTNGRMYHGVLHSVTNEGIILRPLQGARPVTGKGQLDPKVEQAIAAGQHPTGAEPAFFGAWFLIAFALIAGLWARGAGGWGGYGRPGVAGPGYGGYGPGYPGGGWYW